MAIARLNRSYQGPFWPGGTNPAAQAPIFTFDPCPPGSVWTGTISITTSATLTAGTATSNPGGQQSHNDVLVNMIWTMYRNGSPELTWIGLSQAVNVQLYGNDRVVVIGTLPNSGVVVQLTNTNPITLTCTYIGYSGDEDEVLPLSPSVTGSTESTPYQSTSVPSVITTARLLNVSGAGTTPFPLLAPGSANFIRIWSAWIAIGSSTVAASQASAWIAAAGGEIVFTNSVVGGGNAAMSVDLNGSIIQVGSLPINLIVTNVSGTATNILVNAGFTYTLDTLI